MRIKVSNCYIWIIALLFGNFNGWSQAPGWDWVVKAGGPFYDSGKDIAVDASGNSYVTGQYQTLATFDTITLTSTTNSNVYLTKYDPTGNVLWAVKAASSVYVSSLEIDAAGNCYLSGAFGTNPFVTGPNFQNITLTSRGSNDGFLAKYDPSGNIIWVKQLGGKANDAILTLSLDVLGNAYVTGNFGEINPGDSLSFGNDTLINRGGYDIFIAKFDSLGNEIWARQAGGKNYEYVTDHSIDANGNIYLTGYVSDSAYFGNTILLSNDFWIDMFLAKYDAAGTFQWVQKASGPRQTNGNCITTDMAGNSYVTGYLSGDTQFGNLLVTTGIPGGGEASWIAKYDAGGNVQWVHLTSGPSGGIIVNDLVADTTGNSYITGRLFSSLNLNGLTLSSSSDSTDIFIIKLNGAGNLIWGQRAGGIDHESSNAIALDGLGNCYITGEFGNIAGASTTFGSTTLPSAGQKDVFIAKLGNPLLASQSSLSTTAFSHFPNPAHSYVRLTNLSQSTRCTLYNLLGQQVLSQALPLSSTEATLSLQGLAPGLYTLQIQSAAGSRSEMLIVE